MTCWVRRTWFLCYTVYVSLLCLVLLLCTCASPCHPVIASSQTSSKFELFKHEINLNLMKGSKEKSHSFIKCPYWMDNTQENDVWCRFGNKVSHQNKTEQNSAATPAMINPDSKVNMQSLHFTPLRERYQHTCWGAVTYSLKPCKERMMWDRAGRQRQKMAEWVWARENLALFLFNGYTNMMWWSTYSLKTLCLHSTADLLCGWLAQHGLAHSPWWHLGKSCGSAGSRANSHVQTRTHMHSWYCGCVWRRGTVSCWSRMDSGHCSSSR